MDRILQDKFVRQFGWNSAIKFGDEIKDVDYYTSILEDRDNNSSFLDRNTAKAIAGLLNQFLSFFYENGGSVRSQSLIIGNDKWVDT